MEVPERGVNKCNFVVVFYRFLMSKKKDKASCEKYKPYILKYKPYILKYVPCIFELYKNLANRNL